MPDKVEKEIEEILSKFSEFSGETENKPTEHPEIIPFTKKPGVSGHWKSLNKNRRFEKKSVFSKVNLTSSKIFISSSVLAISGFLLKIIWGWEGFLWIAFTGILIFLTGFVWNLFISKQNYKGRVFPSRASKGTQGGYWRGRYIEYGAKKQNFRIKIKKPFRD